MVDSRIISSVIIGAIAVLCVLIMGSFIIHYSEKKGLSQLVNILFISMIITIVVIGVIMVSYIIFIPTTC